MLTYFITEWKIIKNMITLFNSNNMLSLINIIFKLLALRCLSNYKILYSNLNVNLMNYLFKLETNSTIFIEILFFCSRIRFFFINSKYAKNKGALQKKNFEPTNLHINFSIAHKCCIFNFIYSSFSLCLHKKIANNASLDFF